jgi:hypothetical protein
MKSFLILHGHENHRPPGHWQFWLAAARLRHLPGGAARGLIARNEVFFDRARLMDAIRAQGGR